MIFKKEIMKILIKIIIIKTMKNYHRKNNKFIEKKIFQRISSFC